jgi:hypothetical protein
VVEPGRQERPGGRAPVKVCPCTPSGASVSTHATSSDTAAPGRLPRDCVIVSPLPAVACQACGLVGCSFPASATFPPAPCVPPTTHAGAVARHAVIEVEQVGRE